MPASCSGTYEEIMGRKELGIMPVYNVPQASHDFQVRLGWVRVPRGSV